MTSADYRTVTVIIAALDEEESIERAARAISAAVPGAEILIVDGGTDRTSEIVLRLAESDIPRLRLVRNRPDRGKGHAIRVGIERATGDVHAQIDADLQFSPDELPRLLAPILAGEADVTLGSRFMRGAIRHDGSTPLFRTLGNKTASLYSSLVCGQRITDPQAGMKAWTRSAIETVGLRSDNYSYEAEIAVKAVRRGLRVRDVPITTDARTTGATKVNVVRDGLRLLRDITLFGLGR